VLVEREIFADWRPPYAYVPGRSPRHAENLFDRFKVDANIDDDQFSSSNAWRFGLAFLNDGYFWESHEVLESIWLAAAQNSAQKCMVQGIIQLANAGLKFKMKQDDAGNRLLIMADGLIEEASRRGGLAVLGLSAANISILRAVVETIRMPDYAK